MRVIFQFNVAKGYHEGDILLSSPLLPHSTLAMTLAHHMEQHCTHCAGQDVSVMFYLGLLLYRQLLQLLLTIRHFWHLHIHSMQAMEESEKTSSTSHFQPKSLSLISSTTPSSHTSWLRQNHSALDHQMKTPGWGSEVKIPVGLKALDTNKYFHVQA